MVIYVTTNLWLPHVMPSPMHDSAGQKFRLIAPSIGESHAFRGSDREWFRDRWFRLFSHNLDHDFPVARMVQFYEEDALVTPELH